MSLPQLPRAASLEQIDEVDARTFDHGTSGVRCQNELMDVANFNDRCGAHLTCADVDGESMDSGRNLHVPSCCHALADDLEPTSAEFDELLLKSENTCRILDENTEMFHSIPNLAYTHLDHTGNIVTSESNMLRGDDDSLSEHEQTLDISQNRWYDSDTRASSQLSIKASQPLLVPVNRHDSPLVTQSYQQSSEHSAQYFARSHSVIPVSIKNF